MTKDIVFSGVQPSGSLTIGNYLGALKNFVVQQDTYDCIYCIVDLHALTSGIDPEKLRANSLEVLALYLAVGLDPNKSIIYFQSHVPAHTELQWVLNSITPLGQLQRMTQFKAKAERAENIYAGLLNYPILMASDIILYDAKYVPVGDDQKQHLEFTRDLVEKFNHIYGDTFVMPEMLKTQVGSRIMSLQDPTSKMSKSDQDPNSYISMLDPLGSIKKKVMRAVTDSLNNFSYNNNQLGLKNLIEIYSSLTIKKPEEIVELYRDKGYGSFKKDLVDLILLELEPIQSRFKSYIENPDKLEKIYKDGAKKANEIANGKLEEVYKKIGLVDRN